MFKGRAVPRSQSGQGGSVRTRLGLLLGGDERWSGIKDIVWFVNCQGLYYTVCVNSLDDSHVALRQKNFKASARVRVLPIKVFM